MSFYSIATRNLYNVTVMQRFEAEHVKCVNMFFGYARLDSITSMLDLFMFFVLLCFSLAYV